MLLYGQVVKIIDNKTISVLVSNTFFHDKYKVSIKRKRKVLCEYNSSNSEVKVGCTVKMKDSKKFSKRKSCCMVDD
jgi:ribosomal protein S17